MSLGFLAPFQDRIYALMRIVVGFLFFCHGLQKVFGLLGGTQANTALMGVGGIIELVGGAMIAAGFMTGIAAFLASGMMAVGYFMAHQSKGALPIQNGGELAVAYAWVFLYLAAKGSGTWSVDATRKGGGGS